MAENFNKHSHELVFSSLERLATVSSYLARSVELAGNVAGYAMWQRQRNLVGARFTGREALWRATIFPRITDRTVVLEFGVASGAATKYWLANLFSPGLRWHGFDVFTGLPEAWTRGGVQYSAAGRFDVGGTPPDIADPRLTWHVGLIEDTLPNVDPGDGPLCILLDLDLYTPSAFVLGWLGDRLKPGDLLYFDEIYDPWHERKALDEFLEAGHSVRPLGSTGMAAAYEYTGRFLAI